jgi:hypothetical protein
MALGGGLTTPRANSYIYFYIFGQQSRVAEVTP